MPSSNSLPCSLTARVSERATLKGSYVLVLCLAEGKGLTVGKLGAFDFPPGNYLYFGSALNGLGARIQRHLRRDKKRHWHIDFLTAVASVMQVRWMAGNERWECRWANATLGYDGVTVPVKGFGSSDCRCPSHLVHLGRWTEAQALLRALVPGRFGDWPR